MSAVSLLGVFVPAPYDTRAACTIALSSPMQSMSSTSILRVYTRETFNIFEKMRLDPWTVRSEEYPQEMKEVYTVVV